MQNAEYRIYPVSVYAEALTEHLQETAARRPVLRISKLMQIPKYCIEKLFEIK